ncbi:MAG: hypothetical protein WC916_02335 [Candidatus Woesearchaeota archaeon]
MSWPVSIRDTRILEDCLKNNKEIVLDDACEHNSDIFYTLLQYADKVMPEMILLTDKQIHIIADSVAYLVRTDSILNGYNFIGPNFAPCTANPKMYTEDGFQVHLRNNPELLHPNLKLDDKYTSTAAELFRCYSAALEWSGIGNILDDKTLGPAFKLADATAFLLVSTDLIDYTYTKEETERFNKSIIKRASEI